MLSLFPQILFLSPFAALLIRATLALFLGFVAWRHLGKRDTITRIRGAGEIALSATLFVGAWTQPAALIGFLACLVTLFYPKLRAYPLSTTILATVMFASLVVTGPGAFAFDLPL